MAFGRTTIDEIVGQRIATARAKIGMSQPELATKLEISLEGMECIESGERRCAPEQIVKLAEVLNVNPSSLFGVGVDGEGPQ